MSYGKKLQPGDRWKVGGVWRTYDCIRRNDEYHLGVQGDCGLIFDCDGFKRWAAMERDCADQVNQGPHADLWKLRSEAACIAQQIIAEGLL